MVQLYEVGFSRFYSLDFMYIIIVLLNIRLIIPDGVHAEALLRDVTTRHTGKLLVTPAVHLNEAELVVTDGNPLIGEIARADSVGVTTAGGGRVDEELTLDLTGGTELESSDVSSHIEVAGTSGREQVIAALGGEGHVTAVLIAGRKTLETLEFKFDLGSSWRALDLPEGSNG